MIIIVKDSNTYNNNNYTNKNNDDNYYYYHYYHYHYHHYYHYHYYFICTGRETSCYVGALVAIRRGGDAPLRCSHPDRAGGLESSQW